MADIEGAGKTPDRPDQSVSALPKLVTPAEVAAMLHTTTAALSQDRYLGQGIPYVKHGRKVLYRWEDLHSYLAANTVNPGAA
ncbi:helix-turn-helix domain-containing protein [Gordonia westfalica]|uniref:Helix-turn-helix domain-containing protein n=1 Tax=Gordonia westfalica TaxID=158898 RepID=A0ABU2GWM2_9ACTN|nr:helix-turn-helix domain-containing protein [Gordonia westfalica]MDS1115305.1 helix-turn-helix domain-containing protein [Gordonia westfalica]